MSQCLVVSTYTTAKPHSTTAPLHEEFCLWLQTVTHIQRSVQVFMVSCSLYCPTRTKIENGFLSPPIWIHKLKHPFFTRYFLNFNSCTLY